MYSKVSKIPWRRVLFSASSKSNYCTYLRPHPDDDKGQATRTQVHNYLTHLLPNGKIVSSQNRISSHVDLHDARWGICPSLLNLLFVIHVNIPTFTFTCEKGPCF